MSTKTMTVEVAYATPEQQFLLVVDVPAGSTALEVIQASNIFVQVPELQIDALAVGVFSQQIKNPETYKIKAGDRLEIYRPLLIDPMQARRKRAKK